MFHLNYVFWDLELPAKNRVQWNVGVDRGFTVYITKSSKEMIYKDN
jgi:hypothetical protein